MTLTTATFSYLYPFKYDYHHGALCELESRQLFDTEQTDKVLFSNIKVDPSISPFIKNRFEIICSSTNYDGLLINIKKENIHIEGFNVEYVILDGDDTRKAERLEKLKGVGHSMGGYPDFENPTITYAICNHQTNWYFGVLIKHNSDWRKHKKKPRSYSNSISMHIAKTLVSIASKGNKTNQILDACCGVGTVMLEGCVAGFNIAGCDIKQKNCTHTRENLAHYDYTAEVYYSDIKDLDKKCDAAIVDLPYNLYSYSNDAITANIIASTAKLATRVVIVSISDIETIIKKSGLKVVDFCTVEKRGKSKFTRNIWVCEKENSFD
ncbi:MAG: hypothetical protein OCD76_23630 [Reichenbachiella sp.]